MENNIEKFQQMYETVKKQLNETFNPEYFDVGELNVIHKKVGDLENPTFTFKRYNYQGERLYIKLPLEELPDGTYAVGSTPLDWGLGVTGAISKNSRTSDVTGLEKWKADMRLKGKDVDQVFEDSAKRGTICHVLCDYLLKGSVFTKDKFEEETRKIILTEKLMSKYDFARIYNEYSEFIYSFVWHFARWCKEVNLTPIATELVVHNEEYAIASPIDILAEIDVPTKVRLEVPTGEFYKRDCKGGKAGDPKMVEKTLEIPVRKTAIIDLKTSSGTYDSHMYQLLFCQEMLAKTYGIEVDSLLNFYSKDDKASAGAVKIWDISEDHKAEFDILKASIKQTTEKKFRNGIKIFNEENKPKEISLSSVKVSQSEEGKDYVIEGDYLVFEGGIKVNWKEQLNK